LNLPERVELLNQCTPSNVAVFNCCGEWLVTARPRSSLPRREQIEHISLLPDHSVDVIISNCAINLPADTDHHTPPLQRRLYARL